MSISDLTILPVFFLYVSEDHDLFGINVSPVSDEISSTRVRRPLVSNVRKYKTLSTYVVQTLNKKDINK